MPVTAKPNLTAKPTNLTAKPAMPSSYVPPALRTKTSTALSGTKKKELKKEFAMEQTAFPSLGDTIKQPVNRGTPISFSSAAAKKVEIPKPVETDVLPGWVLIRQHGGKIQYKYGKPILQNDDEDRAEQILSRIILKNRIAREHYDRTIDIERLGDLSEFYGQPTLTEIYENDLAAVYLDDANDSSDYNDSDSYNE